ncbi:MAG: MerR family transcriptional regulator [Deltaproteobacteria bacterium]|nr:MerR family transcriptional regulator [Deltaproteobacteria bacterium]
MSTYSIGELATLSGVSVRTLHHYDAIGLLVPASRSEAGYRRYGRAEVERLHAILTLRTLSLPLAEIAAVLDDPSRDRRSALAAWREQLAARVDRDRRLIRSIDALLGEEEAMRDKELFGGFDPAAHEDEARERWGHTEAWRASRRRQRHWTDEDRRRMEEQTAIPYRTLAALRDRCLPPDSPEAREAAEDHRLSIERWFYPCPRELHLGLADLYEADERFAATLDGFAQDLTPYVVAAIRSRWA